MDVGTKERRGSARWLGPVAFTLLLAVLLGALGAWHGARRDQFHPATVTILVNPLEGNPFSPEGRDGLVNLETEAQLVTADAVARTVGKKLGETDLEALTQRVTVEVPSNTQLLRITVTRRNAARARELANGFAAAFLAYRKDRTASTLFTRTAHVTEELRTMKEQLAGLTAKVAAPGTSAQQKALLEQQISGVVSQMASAQAEQTTLGYISTDPGQVVTPATASAAGPLPAVALEGIGGALLGVILAVVLVQVRARRTDTVGSPTDLAAAGHDVLGSDGDVDAIRARLLVELPRRPAVVVLADAGSAAVASAGTGRALLDSLVAAKLRTALVVLDDGVTPPADEEEEPSEEATETEPTGERSGLVEVLTGEATLDRAAEQVGSCGLRLTGGASPSGSRGDLLASPAFETLVKDLRARAEIVIVAGVSLPGPDGQLVAGHADAVVLEATSGVSTNRDVETAAAQVADGPARMLGVVHRTVRRSRGHHT